MSFRERMVDRFFGDVVERRVSARVEALRESIGMRKEDEGWRRLTEDRDRDLAPLTLDRQRELAVYLWTYNPIARRVLETIVEWIAGEGVQVQADDDRTMAFLDQHWDHPVNRWDLKLQSRVRELYLMGEQFWPAFENQFSGLLVLGALDPSRVKEVVTDPDNAAMPIGVIRRSSLGGRQEERRYRVIVPGVAEEVLSDLALRERERFTDGELFLSQVNKLTTQTRGVSELFVLTDWLDAYEDLLFAIIQQEKARANVVWDVELTGADEAEVKKRLGEIHPPKPLSLRVHNEKEKWSAIGPEFGAAVNNAEHARLFRNHVLGGAAIPEHWYGGGGDVNRATAAEMSAPTEKSMTAKQKVVRYVLQDVLSAQIERGIQAGTLPDEDGIRDFTVSMPDLSPRDVSRISDALQKLSMALASGQNQGWVDDQTATRVLASMIALLGIEVEAEEMLDGANQALADKAAKGFDQERLKVVDA